MGSTTEISWADKTFNPWIGCTKVSEGCRNCYAERRSQRFPQQGQWGPGALRKRTSAANWRKPILWDRASAKAIEEERHRRLSDPGVIWGDMLPKPRVFCASLADWLDEEASAQDLADLLALIERTPNLNWLLLTKRPENWRERLGEAADARSAVEAPGAQLAERWLAGDAPDNVWVGTSVEDQAATARIEHLLKIPARVRFLSCEPLISAVDLTPHFGPRRVVCDGETHYTRPHADPIHVEAEERTGYSVRPPRIHWVIAGGESGPGARPMHPEWVRSLRDQCQEAGVAFHFKQWGAWVPVDPEFGFEDHQPGVGWREDPRWRMILASGEEVDGYCGDGTEEFVHQLGKKATGRELDGRTWDEVPRG